MPIKGRIEMLSTGLRTPIGIKISGTDVQVIEEIGTQIESLLPGVKGTRSVFAERTGTGFFLDFEWRRDELARYGLSVDEVQEAIQSAVVGENVTTAIEGRERYAVNVRYLRDFRSDFGMLERILIPVGDGKKQIPLVQLASIKTASGPSMFRNENGLLTGYVYLDIAGRDPNGYVEEANGLLTWVDLLEKTIRPIEQQITPIIENTSFQHTLNLSFTWDAESTINCSPPYNTTRMDDWPSIRADFRDPDIDLQICQIPARAFFGLMNAGATASISSTDVSFGLGLDGIVYPYEIMLQLPTNISLNEQDSIYTWNKTKSITGTFRSNLQSTTIYTDENIDSRIEIDLSKMDLNVPSVFIGKTELTVSAKMKEDDHLFVIRRNDKLSFSQKINITYLYSDALRLCIEENVFNESQVTSFLSKKTEMFQQRLSDIFQWPGTPPVYGGTAAPPRFPPSGRLKGSEAHGRHQR